MTTLYRPVRIETAEQAEHLPSGTSVKRTVWHGFGDQDYYAGVKIGFNTWFTTSPTAERQDALSRHMVGWTAFVPVEAHTQDHAPEPGWGEREQRHRYVTAWLPGPSPNRRGDCA